MGQCISLPHRRSNRGGHAQQQQRQQATCEIQRLPHQVLLSILTRLDFQELMQTVPLVCSAWQQASSDVIQRLTLDISSPRRQEHLPALLTWLLQHSTQLTQLTLSSTTPLGHAARSALLGSLCSHQGTWHCSSVDHTSSFTSSVTHPNSLSTDDHCSSSTMPRWPLQSPPPEGPGTSTDDHCTSSATPHWPLQSPFCEGPPAAQGAGASATGHPRLQLQQLVLQMDLDVSDLMYVARNVLQHAPHLHTMKLQYMKPSLADLQLLVLACIVGNLVGVDAPGPVLPRLACCGDAVSTLAAAGAHQLRSLCLTRYDLGSVGCVAAASRLTSLALQHCGLMDDHLSELSSLRGLMRLELPDNHLTPGCLVHMTALTGLTHLDVSVMPSRTRMRAAHHADVSPLSLLTELRGLNLIGFGVADVAPLRGLSGLTGLELGLNPLSGDSLRALSDLTGLKHLELGGVSQAWMLSFNLPPDLTLWGLQHSWYGLRGLEQLTSLDLGGSHFSGVVWTGHMCPLVGRMSGLQRLVLAHVSMPVGKMQYLLPLLTPELKELNIDGCPVCYDDVRGLAHLTQLTRLSASSMSPELDNKAAAQLAKLTSLQHLVVRGNGIGSRGAFALARGLVGLTCLDLCHCPIGRHARKQLNHLLAAADDCALADLEGRCW